MTVTSGGALASASSAELNPPFHAPNRWVCSVQNMTAPTTRFNYITKTSSTAVAFSNYSFSGGSYGRANFTGNDVILFQCSFE